MTVTVTEMPCSLHPAQPHDTNPSHCRDGPHRAGFTSRNVPLLRPRFFH